MKKIHTLICSGALVMGGAMFRELLKWLFYELVELYLWIFSLCYMKVFIRAGRRQMRPVPQTAPTLDPYKKNLFKNYPNYTVSESKIVAYSL